MHVINLINEDHLLLIAKRNVQNSYTVSVKFTLQEIATLFLPILFFTMASFSKERKFLRLSVSLSSLNARTQASTSGNAVVFQCIRSLERAVGKSLDHPDFLECPCIHTTCGDLPSLGSVTKPNEVCWKLFLLICYFLFV